MPIIPVSALGGDNVLERSDRMGWYDGRRFSSIWCDAATPAPMVADFRMPVQLVARDAETRFLAGTVASARSGPARQ